MIRNSLGQFAKKRKPPPPLEYRAPDCPICWKEVAHDGDSFCCYDCNASWDPDRYWVDGEWTDWPVNNIACPAQIEWFNTERLEARYEDLRHNVTECILGDDHGGQHSSSDGFTKWDDDDPRVIRKGSQR